MVAHLPLRDRLLKRTRPAPANEAGGFTMIEVLITMLLLTVVLLGLAALQITTIRQATLSKRANGALRLAQGIAERIQGTPFHRLYLWGNSSSPDWESVKKKDGITDMTNVGEDGESNGPFTAHYLYELIPTTGDRLYTVRVTWLDVAPGNQPTPTDKYRTMEVMLTVRRSLAL
jgi:prepilin-type N-terminal cleavage/methylation domain-containing protein